MTRRWPLLFALLGVVAVALLGVTVVLPGAAAAARADTAASSVATACRRRRHHWPPPSAAAAASDGTTIWRGLALPPPLSVRGGGAVSDDEYDSEYDSDEYDAGESASEEDEDDTSDDDDDEERPRSTGLSSSSSSSSAGSEDWDLVEQVLFATKRILILAGRVTISTVSALQRAIAAASDEDGDGGTFGRMVDAALNPPSEEEEEELAASVKGKGGAGLEQSVKRQSGEDLARSVWKKSESKKRRTASSAAKAKAVEDMGAFLSDAYGVPRGDDDDDASASAPIAGGSLLDSLSSARSRARLLVAFIPATKPSRHHSGKNTYDRRAIASLLSSPVKTLVDKKARKKEEYGSFDLWSAKPGSGEAASAIKMLRAKKVGTGSPTLLVCYGAQGIDSSGRPRLIPKLLAQHHCNPPPTPASMASWLNALRKRHAREYASMHHALREDRYYRERNEGYRSSKAEDKEREGRERQEEEEREAQEEEERRRQAALEERRVELRASLPEEPAMGAKGTVTVALRFADGRTGRRRFDGAETGTDILFNWVDAMFGMERETIELSTMNGAKRFRYEGGEGSSETLQEAGLGKMVGLRVTELEEEGTTATESEEDGGSSDDDEEEDQDED